VIPAEKRDPVFTRRQTLRGALWASCALTLGSAAWGSSRGNATVRRGPVIDPLCTVYRTVNGSPAENVRKVVEMMGGIAKLFGEDDIVLIKPNAQWWNQGATNLAALSTFVDLIMERPGGFQGEVVIAENCHRGNSPAARGSGATTLFLAGRWIGGGIPSRF